MNEQYLKAAKAINEVALFFATEGYHVEPLFPSDHGNMQISIYFKNEDKKEAIEKILKKYSNENDTIMYQKYDIGRHLKLYNLTLLKQII